MSQASLSLTTCPSLPQILSYLRKPKDVQSCLKVNRRLHDVVTRNRHLLAREEISLSVVYIRPQDSRPVGYAISAFMDKKKNYCFVNFSFYEGESLPNDAARIPPPIRTFFEDPEISENGKVRDADDCFKRLLALFVEKFPLDRFRCSNFTESGKLSLLLNVFNQSRATCNTCCLNANEDMELAVVLRSNRVEGKLSFNESFLNLNRKNLQIDLEYCLSFNMGTLQRFLQEWISGERDSLDIRLHDQDHKWRDLDAFHQDLLEFHPTVGLKTPSNLRVTVKRETDQQSVCIKVRNTFSQILVKSYQASKARDSPKIRRKYK